MIKQQKLHITKGTLFTVFVLLFFVPWMWYTLAGISGKETKLAFPKYADYDDDYDESENETSIQITDPNMKPFGRVLLAMNFNHPHYRNIRMLLRYYRAIFGKIVFCGPKKNDKYDVIVINGEPGRYGYMCLAYAINLNPNHDGYMYVNDDMVLNWWSMLIFSRDKIWTGTDILNEEGADMDKPAPCCWSWWPITLKECKKSFDLLYNTRTNWNGQKYIDNYFSNTNGRRLCLKEYSDFMYLPWRLSTAYLTIASQFYIDKVFLEAAVSTIITMLDRKENRINVDGVYLPKQFGEAGLSSGVKFLSVYDVKRSFYHPVKFAARKGISKSIFKNVIMAYSKNYLKVLILGNHTL